MGTSARRQLDVGGLCLGLDGEGSRWDVPILPALLGASISAGPAASLDRGSGDPLKLGQASGAEPARDLGG